MWAIGVLAVVKQESFSTTHNSICNCKITCKLVLDSEVDSLNILYRKCKYLCCSCSLIASAIFRMMKMLPNFVLYYNISFIIITTSFALWLHDDETMNWQLHPGIRGLCMSSAPCNSLFYSKMCILDLPYCFPSTSCLHWAYTEPRR